jgi:glycosyltransferase involved in cell wall biosynthesis
VPKKKNTKTVVLVGPSHPYTGGIAQHTTRLALELEARGTSVVVESWKAQYPKFLYPGPATVPDGKPEVGLPPHLTSKLTWYNPLSWWRAGWRNRSADWVGLSIPTPFHAIPYLVLLWALGKTPTTAGIVHNVLPHESSPVDRILMGLLLPRFDRVIVHNEQARNVAQSLGVQPERVVVRSLPSPWPAEKATLSPTRRSGKTRLLFFGTIRRYKGLDLLLEAMAQVPEVELTIAGEFWDSREPYEEAIDRLGLRSRVTIRSGYVAESDFPDVFAHADALVMPYRSGTGSIVRELAFRFGVPVIARDVGSIAEGIVHDSNGLVVQGNTPSSLVEALHMAADRKRVNRWRKGVGDQREKQAAQWEAYCGVFE